MLTRSGLTYPEVSSKVYHDSFCQSDSSVSLPWVIYFEAFYLQMPKLLFAYEQFIIAGTEDNLQKPAQKLNQIITEYGLNISVQKTESVAFKGRDPVRTEILIKGKR